MIAGAQLIAPQGFGCLSVGCTYYFLCNDALSNRVRLVEFHIGNDISARLITISSFDFEEALEGGLLIEVNKSAKFPPWLSKVEGISIAHLESRRISSVETYSQRVDRRLMAIYDLVQNANQILSDDNPDSIINAHAKSQKPQQNAARLRLWFYAFLVFGRNKWALLPVFHRAGSWDRYSPQRVAKIGRPSPMGKHAGYRCDEVMQELLLGGYLKFRSPYKTHNKIYAEILTNVFGCGAVERDGLFKFHHPEGRPFPSFPQYKYWIYKLVDRKSRSIAVRGKYKDRSLSGAVGSFSERLTNLNQLVEFDGYYIQEKLTGVSEGSIVNGFCVVRAICGMSGMILGIGFAEGKENMDAYRMCLFSMATDKVKFCELFGIEIKSREWPSEGLPGNMVFDGGPGASYDVMSQIDWLSTLELTPSYSGQSKASIEASHPRHKSTRDQPTYTHSKLNFVTMAKREIIQVLSDNRSSDASGRMDEEMYLAGVKPNPLGIWEYWDSRGRNSAIGKEFTSSIRDFLVPHPAIIRRNGVFLYGRNYRSKDLTDTGIFDSVARSGVICHQVYVMTMCVRHIWIDVSGVLYELDAVLPHRVNDEFRDITLRELKEINELRVKSVSEIHGQRSAVEQYYSDNFHQQTDELASSGKRMIGRPKNNAATTRDTDDYKRFMGKAK